MLLLLALALFGRGIAHDLNNVTAILRGIVFLAGQPEEGAQAPAFLRELEAATMGIDNGSHEKSPAHGEWLRLLIAPGGSLGGSWSKASVIDEKGLPWIAKLPSTRDTIDTGD